MTRTEVLDLTMKGAMPSGHVLWLRWSAKTQSGLLVHCRNAVQAEEGASLGTVMLRFDQHLRSDGFDNTVIGLG